MSNSSNKPALIILIVVLLITNLGMLWYFTRDAKEEVKPTTRTQRMAEMMRKELGFDSNQAQEYINLRHRRDSIMAPMNAELREAKIEMIKLMSTEGVTDSMMQLAAEKIAAKQVPIEVAFHQHFKRIQAICNPQQLKSFDSMLLRMVRRSTGDTTVTGNN
jgi:periplasmic protein CpxP/Spy